MPVFSPDQLVTEVSKVEGCPEPNRLLWISETGQLTQFGAFVEVLQPGSRSSIKHWHSAEDEMVYVLDGEITVVEGAAETLMRAGSVATFRAGVPVGHYLENRSAAPTRCLVVGTRAPSIKLPTRSMTGFAYETARCQTIYGLTWLVSLHRARTNKG